MDDNDLWGLTARSRRGRHDRGAGEVLHSAAPCPSLAPPSDPSPQGGEGSAIEPSHAAAQVTPPLTGRPSRSQRRPHAALGGPFVLLLLKNNSQGGRR
ncbi:unnamed protein product [Gadus morhua 'NCC']